MAVWEIIGGGESGGILVRQGRDLKSPQEAARLATGSKVQELELVGERLRYRLETGTGPEQGWISTRISGKELAVCTEAPKLKWMEESAEKMQAFREKREMLPPPVEEPVRLQGKVHPKEKLPAFKRLSHKDMAEMSLKNLPGHFSGMKFPHTAEQLKSFGPSWYTDAFHKFGTLPADNYVTKVVSVEQLPHTGFDAAGGAGHKALIELEYAKKDPNLHTKLFAKYPWDYFGGETAKQYRMQISTYGDMDSAELLTSICCEHLFPFRIPKLYFADINRDTTNYVLIVERIPFAQRGKVVNGKVEKKPRRPFEILPVCGKYQDYLLEDAASIYFALFREMAHLVAWDHQGRYDSFFGPMMKYTEQEFLEAQIKVRKPNKAKRFEVLSNGCTTFLEKGIDFALNVAPQIFTAAGKDKDKLSRMKDEIIAMAPYFEDIRQFLGNSSDWTGAMHMNLQADNAYLWHDEQGDLDVGMFDWCGFARTSYVMNFMGCLSGADADLLDAHEEGLMKMFCDECARYGGPKLQLADLLLRYRLQWPSFVMDCCQWVERDIYRECPREEWHTIKDIMDDKFIGLWNVRCRGTSLRNAFEYYHRRPFKKIYDEWKSGVGREYLSKFTA
ncbi:unnamed protein product [Effrenium voratum]|nr:unnamed protein product [Effrenium voratum]